MLDPWTIIRGEYFPPDSRVVWTSDGKVVRKGVWHFEPGQPWEETTWTDETGNLIVVTHWCGVDESPDGQPDLPPPLKPMKELIAELVANQDLDYDSAR
ncbi:MAG: hypothetical protein JWO08_4553 [Verrucomicrobiaceae bacterium]|nr:hypothetical protein [Verrucomicrobiaceae bacterium]